MRAETLPDPVVAAPASRSLTRELELGLDAPICLTWELTYGCNLACVHCLSSSGRRDPRELTTVEALRFVEELARLRVFYVNIGGGEPTLRRDFLTIVEHAVGRGVGVKFSTNGTTMSDELARRLAALDYVDVQVSLDGASPATNDPVRGPGSFAAAWRAMERLASAGFGAFKVSVVVTRHNVRELDELLAIATHFGAELRLTRLRPSGRGATSWADLRPSAADQRALHGFLRSHPEVLTGDSFFHLSPLGSLAGLNMCGAGRVVCLVDPVGDVYACPFVMHPQFRAGNVRELGGFAAVWRSSPRLAELRRPASGGACRACGAFDACHGGCLAAKFFTGLDGDDPDPECILGHGDLALASARAPAPSPGVGHSRRRGLPAASRVVLAATRR